MSVPPDKQAGGRHRKRRKPPVAQRKQAAPPTKVVGVRLTHAQFEQLQAQARQQQVKKATVLRAAWLGQALAEPLPEVLGPPANPPRVMTLAELAAYRLLVAAAARLLGLSELQDATGQLRAEAREIFTSLRRLLAELVPPRTRTK